MSERSERLFEALNEIDERNIDEAAPEEGRKQFHWKRWGALAAALALVAGIGSYVLPRMGDGGENSVGGGASGADGGSTFMSYAGPVFPLTLAEADPALTAEREITMAFQESTDWIMRWGVRVTDDYTLTNTSGEDKTVPVLYPCASTLQEVWRDQPILTADGQALETTLHAGQYSGGFAGAGGPDSEGRWNLRQLDSWEQYKDLLEDGSYQKRAFGEYPDLSNIPAIVYEFTDPQGTEGVAPSIRAEFELDDKKTQVLSFQFNGLDTRDGWMGMSYFIPKSGHPDEGVPRYLIILGEDVQNMTTQGYQNLGCDPRETIEASVTVRRYESDLDSALRTVTRTMYDCHIEAYRGDNFWHIDNVDYEMYHGLFCDCLLSYGLLSGDPAERYDSGQLDDLDFCSMKRVFYLEAQVTIPAGGSVTLTAEMWKQPSYDFYCAHTENQGVHGYDMVTKLGSNLACTQQAAVLEDNGHIEIVRQNFGFDLEQGINRVILDPDQEHYYLEVKQLPKE